MRVDATNLAGLLLERCEALRAGACVLSPEGHMMAATAVPRSIGPLMRTSAALSILARCGHRDPVCVDLTPDLGLVIIPYVNARGERGRIAALAPGLAFGTSPEFAALCRDASIDARAVRAELGPMARYDARSREALMLMLQATVRDALAIHERDETIASFTTQLAESYDTIDLLYSLGRSMHGPFDGSGFVGMVSERLHTTLNFGWVGTFFDTDERTPARLRGLMFVCGCPPGEGKVLHEATLDLLRRSDEFPFVTSESGSLASPAQPQIAAHAVTCRGRTCGIIVAGAKDGPDPYVSSYDTQLIEASAGFLSAYSDNVSLYEDQVALFMGTVQALSAAIDAKDPYTFGHSERVAWMARELARASGLDESRAERVHIAGLVHDVGKIGVPETVLGKPGKLTPEEFSLIKAHPVIGHRILKDIPGLGDILPGVLHHHERYDGRGYPSGLVGESIPFVARLIAVADTFDAMSSNRSYRSAMARDRVIAEIERCAGTQLDPAIAMLVRKLDLTELDRLLARHAGATSKAA
jgi:HD-GYP domain-containing protein (c-di-GMP phosphodiesterase class II)